MIAFLFPAIQIFGKKKPAAAVTDAMLPANASQEEVYSAMMGAGLYKSLAVLLALVVLVVFVFWAWGQVKGD